LRFSTSGLENLRRSAGRIGRRLAADALLNGVELADRRDASPATGDFVNSKSA
jgi:hypothetical protein